MTLVSKSFVFKSWNEVIFDSNLFMFLEEDAFMGITEPNSGEIFDYEKVLKTKKLKIGSEQSIWNFEIENQ